MSYGLTAALRKASLKCFKLSGVLAVRYTSISLIKSVCAVLTPPPQTWSFSLVISVFKHILHSKQAPKCYCILLSYFCPLMLLNMCQQEYNNLLLQRRLITTRKEMSMTDTLYQFKIVNKICCFNLSFSQCMNIFLTFFKSIIKLGFHMRIHFNFLASLLIFMKNAIRYYLEYQKVLCNI